MRNTQPENLGVGSLKRTNFILLKDSVQYIRYFLPFKYTYNKP